MTSSIAEGEKRTIHSTSESYQEEVMEKVIEIVRSHAGMGLFYFWRICWCRYFGQQRHGSFPSKGSWYAAGIFDLVGSVNGRIRTFENVIVGWIALLRSVILAGYLQTRNLAVLANRELGQIKDPRNRQILSSKFFLRFSSKYFAGDLWITHTLQLRTGMFSNGYISLVGYFLPGILYRDGW